MKKYLLVLLVLSFTNTFSQIDIGGGMGLAFFNSSDMSDYINGSFANSTDELKTFNSSADFFIEIGLNINAKYQVAIDYTYNIFSFNSPYQMGVYDLSVTRHKPTVLGYYVIPGTGYKFKFGVGVGPRLLKITETIYGPNDYSTSGLGFLLKAQGDTKLSNNFYALIAGELRYDLPGKIHTLADEVIGFNSVSAGLKLGINYYF